MSDVGLWLIRAFNAMADAKVENCASEQAAIYFMLLTISHVLS